MARLGIVDAEKFAKQNDAFYAQYKDGTLDIHAYLNAQLSPLARHPRTQLDDWHAQFMREVITPAIQPAALELVRKHQEAGDLCCLVTATNAFITAPIGQAFGIDALIACEVETVDNIPNGELTGRPTGTPSFREGKIVRTEMWLASMGKSLGDFEHSYFYSDSHNDIPLLEKVTDPIATNPDDTLRAHAQSRGWRILEIFSPRD
ncbi:Phosphoserine phosphatase [Caballeronia sordidicola]|uniref:Phosphoserine phosphatase n=2 Tax=Burkholderiales TaxID=80840 RepID=A0A242MDL0_CABSO|nr:Phosphoserine phosphatase [Caballeronia sordidicola]